MATTPTNGESGLHVRIVTPTMISYTGTVDEVQAPGVLGEFGVLPEHAPLLSVTQPGVVTLYTGTDQKRYLVGSGFAEAGPSHITLLVDLCEEVESIDKEAAQSDLAESESQMNQCDSDSAEWATASEQAKVAQARLDA